MRVTWLWGKGHTREDTMNYPLPRRLVMNPKILAVLVACLIAAATSTARATDGTVIAPPSLIYEMPEASTALYAERALNAQNAVNAANCTGGPAGHCSSGSDPISGSGNPLTYAPDPAENIVLDSWKSSGPACSLGREYTVVKTPWALYSDGVFIMMMPESAQALNEQDYLEQGHLPTPSPWTDSRTTTFSYSGAFYRVPPPLGHRCP